jgi:hypothetical protein
VWSTRHDLPSARLISCTRVEALTAWLSRWAKADHHTTPPSGHIAVVLPPSPLGGGGGGAKAWGRGQAARAWALVLDSKGEGALLSERWPCVIGNFFRSDLCALLRVLISLLGGGGESAREARGAWGRRPCLWRLASPHWPILSSGGWKSRGGPGLASGHIDLVSLWLLRECLMRCQAKRERPFPLTCSKAHLHPLVCDGKV